MTGTVPGDVVLEVRDLRTHFVTRRGIGRAVDGVSFALRRGETLGLVGESGCGKSMTCLSIVRLHPRPAARIVGGQVLFRGEDLLAKSAAAMRRNRGRHLAMILQDPMTALNPVFTVGNQLAEPLRLHGRLRGRALWRRAAEAMRLVRIPEPEARLRAYPHQLSGGMRQRAVGAIALACEPDVLIADEPTTALDVTIQAAYLALLKEIQARTRLAILFVTHDFSVVARMCDRVAVMYAGKIVADVGLDPAAASQFPHEFSGGQRQRIAVARALSLSPRLIVLDEPVSALDVSIRAQLMNLLKDLQARYGMSYLLIAHNLATVRYLCHRVAVMYLGQIVEEASAETLFTRPLHPYTKALISAALPVRPDAAGEAIVLPGEVPSPTAPPPGCRFHPRCPFVMDRCRTEPPALRDLAPDQRAACHLY